MYVILSMTSSVHHIPVFPVDPVPPQLLTLTEHVTSPLLLASTTATGLGNSPNQAGSTDTHSNSGDDIFPGKVKEGQKNGSKGSFTPEP